MARKLGAMLGVYPSWRIAFNRLLSNCDMVCADCGEELQAYLPDMAQKNWIVPRLYCPKCRTLISIESITIETAKEPVTAPYQDIFGIGYIEVER